MNSGALPAALNDGGAMAGGRHVPGEILAGRATTEHQNLA
jgi:hypothetical protein